jgi:hypothetical protein
MTADNGIRDAISKYYAALAGTAAPRKAGSPWSEVSGEPGNVLVFLSVLRFSSVLSVFS